LKDDINFIKPNKKTLLGFPKEFFVNDFIYYINILCRSFALTWVCKTYNSLAARLFILAPVFPVERYNSTPDVY